MKKTVFSFFLLFFLDCFSYEILTEMIFIPKEQAPTLELSAEKKNLSSLQRAILELTYRHSEILLKRNLNEKDKELIENKVLKKSKNYILSYKSEHTDEGSNFYIKVSLDHLKKALLNLGLIYEQKKSSILPMILVTDVLAQKQQAWWLSESSKDYEDYLKAFFKSLNKSLSSFSKVKVPSLKKLSQKLDPSLVKFKMSLSDYEKIYEHFNYSIILKAHIKIKAASYPNQYQLKLRMKLEDRNHQRKIASFYHSEVMDDSLDKTKAIKGLLKKAEKKIYPSLSNYLKNALLNSQLAQIAIEGDITQYQKIQRVKKHLESLNWFRQTKQVIYEPERILIKAFVSDKRFKNLNLNQITQFKLEKKFSGLSDLKIHVH